MLSDALSMRDFLPQDSAYAPLYAGTASAYAPTGTNSAYAAMHVGAASAYAPIQGAGTNSQYASSGNAGSAYTGVCIFGCVK